MSQQSQSELQRARQELANLTRRNIAATEPDGSQTTVPPLGDSDGGPATPEELVWFGEKHPGRPVSEADGPIRVRRQWTDFLGEAGARKLGLLSPSVLCHSVTRSSIGNHKARY